MSRVEVFLDDMPGERRGMIMRDGRFERLLIEREDDVPQHRLGARSVGRVAAVDTGQGGAFVDLGAGAPFGFLPARGQDRIVEGARIEVLTVAEPRETKGPTLRLIGPATGEPRLARPGPDLAERLAELAPGISPVTGVDAIQASWDAEEEALGGGDFFAGIGLDLAIQRTRALIAVDIDYIGLPGRDLRKGRREANRQGLLHAARLIRLRRWGGLVAIDLVGVGHNGDEIGRWARAAFGTDPGVAFGPVNRFGVLQLSLPWGERPLEEVLHGRDGRPTARTRALDVVRRLRHHMLSDTAAPRLVARCAPDEAALAAPLALRLGPRAGVRADPAVAPGAADIEEA